MSVGRIPLFFQLISACLEVESVRVRLLLLLLPGLHLLLDNIQLLHNCRVAWRVLDSLVQVCQRILLVLLADLGCCSPEVCLGQILLCNALDFKRLGRALSSLVVLVGLVLEKSQVGVYSDLERLEALPQVCWVVVLRRRVFVQVAERLLVLLDSEVEVLLLECSVTHVLQLCRDLQDFFALPLFLARLLILGEVLVWVASNVGGLFGRLLVLIACELAAVWDMLASTTSRCTGTVAYQ